MADADSEKIARDARHRLIVDHLVQQPTVSIAELVELTGRSLMTVHRDVDHLAARGLVRKYRGGVSALPTSVFEAGVEFRKMRQVRAKDALAAVAASFVEPGMSVLLDDSTTVLALARRLVRSGPLTVITNFRCAIDLFVDAPDVRLICIGGRYSHPHDSYISPAELSGLSSYAVDVAFQSTSTMDAQMTYHQEEEVVVMKRTMLDIARRRVLMMDATKVGSTSLHQFVPVARYTDVILPAEVDVDTRRAIADQTRLHLAPADAAAEPTA